MNINPKWNQETCKYEVPMFGQIYEFDYWDEANKFVNDFMEDYSPDPSYSPEDNELDPALEDRNFELLRPDLMGERQ